MADKPSRILLIEDDQMISTMYQTKFTMEGKTIDVAADGATGLEKARSMRPDVILLDIILPKLDGFTVLKELKADATTKKIPVILLTNLGQDGDVKKGKDLGADDYFIKSNHTPAEIVAKVKEILES
ncbi:MAG: response regulator [bacterium]